LSYNDEITKKYILQRDKSNLALMTGDKNPINPLMLCWDRGMIEKRKAMMENNEKKWNLYVFSLKKDGEEKMESEGE
jgi:hypothetical protein